MNTDYKQAINEIIDKISNEEYLELILRFAKRLLGDGGAYEH